MQRKQRASVDTGVGRERNVECGGKEGARARLAPLAVHFGVCANVVHLYPNRVAERVACNERGAGCSAADPRCAWRARKDRASNAHSLLRRKVSVTMRSVSGPKSGRLSRRGSRDVLPKAKTASSRGSRTSLEGTIRAVVPARRQQIAERSDAK